MVHPGAGKPCPSTTIFNMQVRKQPSWIRSLFYRTKSCSRNNAMEISISKTIWTCQRTDKTLSVFQGILPNGSWFWTWCLIILHHGLKITRCFSILGSFRVGVEVCVSAIPIICFSHVKYLQEDPNGWHEWTACWQTKHGENKTEPAPMGIDLWQHVPHLGQATNARRQRHWQPWTHLHGVRREAKVWSLAWE